MNYPHYSRVPKDLKANKLKRYELRKDAQYSKSLQKALLKACAEDTLFFINMFCSVVEPRNAEADRIQPFITWETQDPFINQIDECLIAGSAHSDPEELWVEKSRGEGFTWCVLCALLKSWVTSPFFLVGMTSKDEDSVANMKDPDSLMWKLAWQVRMLPKWMVGNEGTDWEMITKGNVLTNWRNNSSFSGFAATGHAGSGGRKTVWFLDELSKFPRPQDADVLTSTAYVTNIRIVGSTYFGKSGAFYEGMNDDSSLKRKFVFDWRSNPERRKGLYHVVDGKAIVYDPEHNPLPEGYLEKIPDIHKRLRAKGFQIEGTDRSPWYNSQCLRPKATPQSIAQELDRNPSGAEVAFMDPETLKILMDPERGTVQNPKYRGRLSYNPDTFEPRFMEHADGELLVWCDLELDGDGNLWPKRDRDYTIGADISNGVGASNSSSFILDKQTGEQAADYTTPWRRQGDFCRDNIALAKWFRGRSGGGAYLGWENNGPGAQFSESIVHHGYGNVLRTEKKGSWGGQKTEMLGWHSSTADKSSLLGGVNGGGLLEAVVTRVVKIRSQACLKEMGEYVFVGGRLVHRKSRATTNEAEKNEAHGDRVIGAGVAVHMWFDRPQPKEEEPPPAEPEYGSREWRDAQRLRERRDSLDEAFSW